MKPNLSKNLNSRQQKVLGATVDRYIATAEPVGSKILMEEYDFDISAATIRNIMSTLDRGGLLYQPHTSAGRIPSDSGYRVYVNELINPTLEFATSTTQFLTKKLELCKSQSLETLLQSIAQILAAFSGCIALISAPNLPTAKIRHIQLIRVDERKVMMVAVSDSYHTASVLTNIPPEVETESLEAALVMLNNFLNAHLLDRRLSDLSVNLHWEDLDREFQKYAAFIEESLQQLDRACNPTALGQLFISGLTELLRQPEFTQLKQVQAIVQLLEEDQALLFPLMSSYPATTANGVTIKIGTEISLELIQHCTLISSTYSCDDLPVGSIGVLGPTRLAYERAIASVQTVASYLSEVVSLKL